MDYQELTRNALVVDSHNDTIVAHVRQGFHGLSGDEKLVRDPWLAEHSTIAFIRGEGSARPDAAEIQIDFPKMRAAGIDCAFFAIDVTVARGNHLTYALDGIGYFLRSLDALGTDPSVVVVRKAKDVGEARAAGKLAAVLAIEHADCTERSLYVLRSLYELGVRSIGLTHNVSSWAADGCLEARSGVGLTKFGVALVQEMNRLGMLVDLAHVSESAFFSALAASTRPVIFSHGNARALCDFPRNLTDDQLRALRRNGGVIGLSFVPYFVDLERPTLERLLDHVDHIVEVAGIETVGLGSDFDGGGTLLRDAADVPRIVEGLLRRGYSEPDIRKVLGENTLRVLEASIG